MAKAKSKPVAKVIKGGSIAVKTAHVKSAAKPRTGSKASPSGKVKAGKPQAKPRSGTSVSKANIAPPKAKAKTVVKTKVVAKAVKVVAKPQTKAAGKAKSAAKVVTKNA